MGYRLNIDELEKGCLENVYYGTKLYGYKDESNFMSFKYLLTSIKLFLEIDKLLTIPLSVDVDGRRGEGGITDVASVEKRA